MAMSVASSSTLEKDSVMDQTLTPGVKQELDADEFLVHLDPEEQPQNLPVAKKWAAVLAISSASLCVTSSSSMALFAEEGVAQEFRISQLISVLTLSLFVEGLGLGPLLVGPLSEVYGRNLVYRISYGFFFLCSIPVTFSPNAGVFLAFRFLGGFCGSAFLSVAGGSISDLFSDSTVANPMAVYTISPFIGPVVGPLLSGFINTHLYWRWTFRIQMMWVFVQYIALFLFVPETYVPILLKKKAHRLRVETAIPAYWAPLDRNHGHLLTAVALSCYRPFQLMLFDRMALLLNLWTALILGILYLAFQAFPIIFRDLHGFDDQATGMTFLGIGVGMLCAISTQPFWNRLFNETAARNEGQAPPETRLVMGMLGGVLVPVGLFWMAFSTFPTAHWIALIIASVPYGAGIYFVFTSTFTYLVTAYRPIAASAMAANSALRSSFAAIFAIVARPMYLRLGTVGATAMLAGLTTLMTPLPFIFYRIGPRLRKRSRFAVG